MLHKSPLLLALLLATATPAAPEESGSTRAVPSLSASGGSGSTRALPSLSASSKDAAAPLDEAKAAYERQDYGRARALWQPLAEAGNAEAQNNLAVLYHQGLGVEQDYEKSRQWYEKAAAAGNGTAQFNLATAYAEGLGVKADLARAKALYEQAAEAGEADAQFNLALLYLQGRGVKQDYDQARRWFQRAAEAGNPRAQSNLGVFYADGLGVKPDYAEARRWWEQAAAQGDGDAQNNLARLHERGRGAAKDAARNTTARLAEAQAAYERKEYDQARALWQPLAEAGNGEAQYQLARLYRRGQGVNRDEGEGRRWLERAAANGYAPARQILPSISEWDWGVEPAGQQ